MSVKLIGQDCNVTFLNGGPDDGTPNFTGSPVSVKAVLKSFDRDKGVEKSDTSRLGDGERNFRTRRAFTDINLELFIEGAPINVPIGNYIQINFFPLSSMVTPESYSGKLTRDKVSAPDGEQTQSLTIESSLS